MLKMLFSSLLAVCVMGAICFAAPVPSDVNPVVAKKIAIKKTEAWKKMQEQLDQYDTHYTAATNAIEAVTDAKTRTALTKEVKMIDDLKDALTKLIACFKQTLSN